MMAGSRAGGAPTPLGTTRPFRAASAFRDPWPGAGRVLAAISPRAAALATMSMLAFGVIVGSGASSFAASSAPLLLAVSPTTPLAPAPAPPATSSSSPSQSSSPAPAAAPAAATPTPVAQTVTEPAPATNNDSSSSPPPSGPTLPPVKHVFVVMLSDQGYKQSFGDPSNFPYLARTLRHQGELLENYYAVAPSPLSNAIAMISGQGPTVQTAANCPVYTDITPTSHAAEGQLVGTGCVYPLATQSLPDQLTANGDTWKAYVEGIGNGPAGTAKTCRRPTLDAADADQVPQPGDPYVTWRNPFVYFQSLTASTGCNKTDVGMQQLFTDLKSTTKTPSLSYIVPSPCEDGSDQACPPATSTTESTSTSSTSTTTSTSTSLSTTSSSTTTSSTPPAPLTEKQSTTAADKFLQYVIPRIERSPAYKSDGMIAITFDQAPQTGPDADPSACCNNPIYPNLPATTPTTSTTGTTTTTAPTTTGTTTTSSTSTPAAGTTTTGTTSTPTTSGTTSTGTTTTGTTSTPTTSNPLSGGETTPTGGGGQVGLLLISKYVKPNSFDEIDYYNHYSLLASIEQLFSVPRLGYASDPQLPLFDTVTYNAYKG